MSWWMTQETFASSTPSSASSPLCFHCWTQPWATTPVPTPWSVSFSASRCKGRGDLSRSERGCPARFSFHSPPAGRHRKLVSRLSSFVSPYKNISSAWRGTGVNIETHENRFADMESGRDTDGQPGGARPAREVPGKQKPAKRTMFSVISHPATRLEAALSRSPAMLLQKLPRHFRRCGILPRHGGWSAEGIREGGNPQESLEYRFADARGLDTLPVVWRVDGAGWEC